MRRLHKCAVTDKNAVNANASMQNLGNLDLHSLSIRVSTLRSFMIKCTDLGVNAHGHQLVALCRQCGLLLCSGRVRGDDMAVPTFKARSRTQASRLDHVIVSKGVLGNITLSSVNTGRNDSDHHPIETILRVPVSVVAPVQCAGRPVSRVYWRPSARNDYTHA